MIDPITPIAERLATVRLRVARAAESAGRSPGAVRIIAVTKTMPVEAARAAYDAGARDFGENRIQEGTAKIAAFGPSDAVWHLIGHLQTNKARPAARDFGIIHAIDSVRIAEAVAREATALGRAIDVLLEVNVAAEESKYGFTPEDALVSSGNITRLDGLRVIGLMTVAPLVADPEDARLVFRALRLLGERVRERVGNPNVWHLSMGMSNDVDVAIAEGATMVRIGRAIFGERPA
ncbi:MAG: YggS family pyridoxal phosphate-dependent enzyme [Chloroflexota bacterium]|nr:MAG: YggS family pyridoxal phosphate-dependent enzyme [Chloroflexota bacterium]